MEEFIQALLQLVYDGQVPDMNKVQYTEDEDGTVTIKYQKHNYKAELQAFKDYIDTLSDDIFEKSSARFRESNPDEFVILSKDYIENLKDYSKAFEDYKATVKTVVKEKIDGLQSILAKTADEIENLRKFI